MKFAVIGGDMRTLSMCSLLAEDGHEVRTFALEQAKQPPGWMAGSVQDAARGADCVILPLPAWGKGGLLNSPMSAGEFSMEEILNAVAEKTPVCAGMADDRLKELALRRDLELHDYLKREELAVENAVATAEGAVDVLIRETESTLRDSRVLIVGFGRIGKVLAHRLHGMCAAVAVSARSFGDRAWISAYGYEAADTYAMDEALEKADIVVNTVPAMVLGAEQLKRLRPGALCVDLASKPGGVDFPAASQLGIKTVWALSLPGKTAPRSSGRVIRDTIYNILKERGS